MTGVSSYAIMNTSIRMAVMNLIYLGILTLFLYLGIAVAQALHLRGKVLLSTTGYFTLSLTAVGCHGYILHALIDTPLGQNLDWMLMLSFTIWLMNCFTLFLIRLDLKSLSVLTHPFAALTLVLCCYSGSSLVQTKTHPDMLLHIFLSLCALSLLILGLFLSILLSLQNFLLKRRPNNTLLHVLPPLQAMEGLLFFIMTAGVLVLSAALSSGFLYDGPHSTPYLPKIILSIGAWVLLMCLLVGRYFFGWRGPTAFRWTLSGVVLAMLSYFGTKALLL